MLAEQGDVDRAVAAAAAAFEEWSESSLSRRTRILFAFREIVNRRQDEIAARDHRRARQGALRRRRRGAARASRSSSSPAASRSLLKGEYSDQVSTGVDSFSFRQPLGVVAGITPFNFPAMVPDVDVPGGDRLREHVRPQAQRARPLGVGAAGRDVGRGRAARRRLQRACTATRSPSTGCSTTPTSPPSPSSAPPRSRSTCTSGAPAPASGCRRSAARRTTRSCCPTPTWSSPPTTWPPRPTARPGSGAWRSRRRSPSARSATSSSTSSTGAAAPSGSARAASRAATWARSSRRPRGTASSR